MAGRPLPAEPRATPGGGRLRAWSRHLELRTLLAFALAALFLWGFVELADEVVEGSASRLDVRVLLWFRSADDLSDPLGPWWVEEAMRDVTSLGSLALLTGAVLVAAGYLLMARRARTAAFLAVATGSGVALTFALKAGFDRARPDLVPHGAEVGTAGFPSGHAMMSALVWLTLAALLAPVLRRRRLQAYALAVALGVTLLVGLSRVYLGVHWPSDVLAGWTAGTFWALGSWAAARVFLRAEWGAHPTPAASG